MRSFKPFCLAVTFLALSLPLFAADKNKANANSPEASKPSYELPQPAKESLDYTMYQRIRDEGLGHSHVMEYASALMDGIGPRLTGSPNLKRANEWTRDQLAAIGCSNAHLEDWGEFGMGWQQLNTWTRMAAPDTAVFITQAAPWSPSSHGAISGQAILMDVKKEEDLDKYRGKISGNDANRYLHPVRNHIDFSSNAAVLRREIARAGITIANRGQPTIAFHNRSTPG